MPRLLIPGYEEVESGRLSQLLGNVTGFFRRCLFRVLSRGPMPDHIAFILDGNRRYARKWRLKEGDGHRVGFLTFLSIMKYCYEMGIKYTTIYVFSIDNFKRKPHEVQDVMDLLHEKIQGLICEERIVNAYGVRVIFLGNLKLLPVSVREAAQKAMELTAGNTRTVLLICAAYTSTDEITHSVQGSCKEKWRGGEERDEEVRISLAELERHFFLGDYPDVDVLVRTSGETRLSNFLLWQTTFACLSNPKALWPELSLWDLVWAIVQFQRAHPFLEKNRKKIA